MSHYDGILIPALLIIDILFLYGLTRFVNGLAGRRNRVLVPVAAIILYICVMFQFDRVMDKTTIGGILLFTVPTLAVLTVSPFFESNGKMRNRGILITIISFPLTMGFLFYQWAWSFSGIPTIFLPMEAAIPASSPFFLPVGLLFWYGQLLIVCGTLAGAIVLARSYEQYDASGTGSPDSGGRVAPIVLLGIGSVFINSLVIGFLAIFLYLVIREIPIRAVRVAVPLIAALIIAIGTSLMLPQNSIRFSLFVLLFLALGTTILFPVFERYFIPKEMTGLYIGSTATVLILALLFHDPAANLFGILGQGLSTITDSGVFAVGDSVAEGMANKLALFGSAVTVSGFVYAALGFAMLRIRKNQDRFSSARAVPEETPDYTGGSGQPDRTGHAERTGETRPEETDGRGESE